MVTEADRPGGTGRVIFALLNTNYCVADVCLGRYVGLMEARGGSWIDSKVIYPGMESSCTESFSSLPTAHSTSRIVLSTWMSPFTGRRPLVPASHR